MSDLLASWFGRGTSSEDGNPSSGGSPTFDTVEVHPLSSSTNSARPARDKPKPLSSSGGAKLLGPSEDTRVILQAANGQEVEKILYVAAGYEDFETVKRLLETKKGDLDWQNPNDMGKTALHKAAEKGCVTIIALLVAEGAEVGLRDHHNRTPLHLALQNKHEDATSLLLETTVDALRKRTHSCLTLEEKVDRLESTRAGSRDEVDTLRDQVSELKSNLAASERGQRKLERDLSANASDLGQRVVDLEQELEEERRRRERAQRQAERRHRELTQRNEEILEENKRLTRELRECEDRLRNSKLREVQLQAHARSPNRSPARDDISPSHSPNRRSIRSKSISHVAHRQYVAAAAALHAQSMGDNERRGSSSPNESPGTHASSRGYGSAHGSSPRSSVDGHSQGDPKETLEQLLGDPVPIGSPPDSPEPIHRSSSGRSMPRENRLVSSSSESSLFPHGSASPKRNDRAERDRRDRMSRPAEDRPSPNSPPHRREHHPKPGPQKKGPAMGPSPLRRGESFDERQSHRATGRRNHPAEMAQQKPASPQAQVQSREAEFARGIVCNGKYRLLHMEGKGGMATVWRAVGVETKDLVAIKIFEYKKEIPMTREKYVEYACRECAIHESMKHPNIVRLLETFSINKKSGVFGVVMELCDGDLQSLIDEKGGTLSEREARRIMQQVFSALEYLATHHHVIHGDLKPSNILFRQGAVKLADFGVSKEIPRGRVDVDLTTRFATVGYAAPEYYDPNNFTISSAVDVYAAGKIMYRMLCGDLPREQHGRVEQPLYFPRHIPISPEGQMFIRTCLADKRCEVAYICRHPYLH